MPRTARRPIETQKSPLAVRIGARLRAARLKAGMTQQQLAGDRYTKAYVSALENALIKPSMVALDYLAGRLGTTASQLMADEEPAWSRLEADLNLAAGRWEPAADAYRGLLAGATDELTRAALLRSLAEALVRLDRGAEATAAAGEAVEIFEKHGREVDAALASYWLSAGLYQQDNTTEAKAILHALLGKVRAGVRVEPGFKLRLLMALSTNESREGNHEAALAYLEEIRSLADTLDDRRRAAYLFDLSYSYRETGDIEAALRTGYASLALFEAASSRTEIASLENDLALAHLRLGNTARAEEMAAAARAHFAQYGDERMLAHVTETEAQIAAARGNWQEALRLADDALAAAERTANPKATVHALLTSARAHAALSNGDAALAAHERAAALARQLGRPALLRRALAEWADYLAQA
ncbi:MAG: helix-turn-helix domain-containing protein, partial [Chloroflexota bacterium]|nr:helix-turn-helix domain-containing protein [Chloroflexota bacterium]